MGRPYRFVVAQLLLAGGGVLAQNGQSTTSSAPSLSTITTGTSATPSHEPAHASTWPLITLVPTQLFPILATSAQSLDTPEPPPIRQSTTTSLNTPGNAPTLSPTTESNAPPLSIPWDSWIGPFSTVATMARPTMADPANSLDTPQPLPQTPTAAIVPNPVNSQSVSPPTTPTSPPNGGNGATPGPSPSPSTPSPTAFVIYSQTLALSQPVVLSQGQSTVVISLTTDSVGATNVVFGTTSQPLSIFLSSNPGVVPVPAPTRQVAADTVTVAGVAFSVNPTATGVVQIGSTSLTVGQTITQGSGPSATVLAVQTASNGELQVVVLGPSTTLTQAFATASSTSDLTPSHVMSSITVNPTHTTSLGAASPTETKKSNAQKLVAAGATVMAWWSLMCYAMA